MRGGDVLESVERANTQDGEGELDVGPVHRRHLHEEEVMARRERFGLFYGHDTVGVEVRLASDQHGEAVWCGLADVLVPHRAGGGEGVVVREVVHDEHTQSITVRARPSGQDRARRRVPELGADGLRLAPGVGEKDVLDIVVGCFWGRDEKERGRDVEESVRGVVVRVAV